jgi:hypothetical protein
MFSKDSGPWNFSVSRLISKKWMLLETADQTMSNFNVLEFEEIKSLQQLCM